MSNGFRARHLAIVGLGLMGGSRALAMRAHAEHISGIDHDERARAYALKRGIVDCATDDLHAGVNRADVVILAAPVRVIIEMLQMRIGSYLRSNTLVIDIGSTKQDIVDAMASLPIGVNAVGGHPMTGKENGGIEESDESLYRSRPFVLCPSRRTTPAARLHALSFVETLGAAPIEMEAERFARGDFHDPAMIHGEHMAGLHQLVQGHERLSIEYSEIDDGGQILYSTEDQELVAAIHKWFDAQLRDHGEHASGHRP